MSAPAVFWSDGGRSSGGCSSGGCSGGGWSGGGWSGGGGGGGLSNPLSRSAAALRRASRRLTRAVARSFCAFASSECTVNAARIRVGSMRPESSAISDAFSPAACAALMRASFVDSPSSVKYDLAPLSGDSKSFTASSASLIRYWRPMAAICSGVYFDGSSPSRTSRWASRSCPLNGWLGLL